MANIPVRDGIGNTIYYESRAANSNLDPAPSPQTIVDRLGILTETAPNTDTASAGLNGRLQRIAQRITTLLTILPTSLGIKTSANSFPVVLSSDQLATLLGAFPATLGQKTSANSLSVVVASDQLSQPVTMTAINLSAVSGDQTIISPTAGKALRIYNLVLSNATTLTSFALRSGTSGQGQVNLTSAIAAYDYAGDFSPPLGLPVDRSFVINLPSSGSLTGYVTWREE
jgi:hypothetical protein